MLIARMSVVLGGALLLAACDPNQMLPNPTLLGGTALRPPVADLAIGTLFYTKEANPNLKGIVSFYPLCTPDLTARGFPPPTAQGSIKELNLLPNVGASGELSGIETEMASLGLQGGISRYFEYKLTNITVVSYDAVTAQNILETMDSWDRCKTWRKAMPGKPVYQISLAYRGDIVFSQKNDASVDANLSAKIASLEPKLKLALKNATQYGVSGPGLFVVVEPVQRQ